MSDYSKLQELEHKHFMNCLKIMRICLTSGKSTKELEEENSKIDKQITELRNELGLYTISDEELEIILENKGE